MPPSPLSPSDPTAVLTGASRGIGRATALGLAHRGWHVVVVARSAARGEETVEELAEASGAARFSWVAADLGRPDQIEAAAGALLQRIPRIQLLVNNAGVMNRRHATTAEGVEETLAVNHLAPVRLTHHLLPGLLAAGDARVVTLSSQAHAKRLDLTAFEGPRGYSGIHAYAQSKLLNLLHAFDLAGHLRGTGVTVNAVHPGLVGTDLLDNLLPDGVIRRTLSPLVRWVARTPEEGARTPLHAATSPEVAGTSGRYFAKEALADPAPAALERENQEGVRRWTEGLTGIDWGRIPEPEDPESQPARSTIR